MWDEDGEVCNWCTATVCSENGHVRIRYQWDGWTVGRDDWDEDVRTWSTSEIQKLAADVAGITQGAHLIEVVT